MAKGKKPPKYKVGQVVFVDQDGDYRLVVGVWTDRAGIDNYYEATDGLGNKEVLGENELRKLTKREIGPTRKLKGER